MAANNERPIIIKKIKKGGHGHHGGAWKVAYADFVTAMMAFFLLLWLLNTTTPEQKLGIADYFAPASVSATTSGAGGIFGGTSFNEDGARRAGALAIVKQDIPSDARRSKRTEGERDTDAKDTNQEQEDESPEPNAPETLSETALDRALALREAALFQQAEMSIRQAMQDMPELAELSKQLIIDHTPEGMRIQLIDQEGRAMFPADSAEPFERTKSLLRHVAKIIRRLPNRVSISGHTDGAPFYRDDGYTNWEMSSDRANAARRVIMASGVNVDRVALVSGKAGTDPLFPDDPYAPANRRISIVLLREAPPLPPGHSL